MKSLSVDEFSSVVRKHVKKIDDATLLTSNEKEHRKHEFKLLIIDLAPAFGVGEESLSKSCNL